MPDNTQFHRAEKLMEINRFREAIPFLTKANTENNHNNSIVCLDSERELFRIICFFYFSLVMQFVGNFFWMFFQMFRYIGLK